MEKDSISLFVDNLPNSIHWKGLWHIVGRYGEVLSVYLPSKRSRAGSRFGFVKVGNMVEANRVKERLNGLMVYGSRISVSFAKYSLKASKEKCEQCKLSWKGNIANPFATGISQSKEASLACASRKEVKGHVDEDEVRKLKRCLVGVMAGVCTVGSIVDRLHNWGLGEIKVQRLRGNSFLLTIDDEDLFIMLEDLRWSYLKEIFVDVMLWTEFEEFGDNVSHYLDCEKVNILITTSSEARIDEVVDVVVENKKFDVRVLEVRMVDHSLGNLSKSEILKKIEIEVEKNVIEVGANNVGVSPIKDDLSVASESSSSDGKKGSPACSGDILCYRKKVSIGKTIEVESGVEDGGQSFGFQISDHCNHVGLGRSVGLVLGPVNSLKLGDISKMKISEKESFGGVLEDVSCVPETPNRNKKKMHKFGSMMDIQDSVLSKAERSRRDRALKSSKLKKSDLDSTELSGRSISDSVLKKKWVVAYTEAEETLSVEKRCMVLCLLGLKGRFLRS
ncbi:hypothetical protein F3Y22_tig00111445pilonHSYRG00069 [Hibiscus syriacus]|uniref:RRM domain-containing protein n=1 Tax=Hibiscus syriacus TaxID=106335 RepID=A0A6A2YFD3_HIBSY|nr:hypothetical protein F3Y22_tig00111445pilonHSYRG00069 [Hibiscus syriacus]